MNINELNEYLQSLPEEILAAAAEIVAETATEYYKETFSRKAFDGNPWVPAKTPKQTGSLLVDSSEMLGSVRPTLISPEKVVISAGNDKVEYAAVHNEGFSGVVSAWNRTREEDMQLGWEQTRFLAMAGLQPWSKRTLRHRT